MTEKPQPRPCRCCSGSGKEFDDKEIGAWFRDAREDCDVTLREMSRTLGYSHSYLVMLEQGKKRWTATLIDGYSRTLGMSPR